MKLWGFLVHHDLSTLRKPAGVRAGRHPPSNKEVPTMDGQRPGTGPIHWTFRWLSCAAAICFVAAPLAAQQAASDAEAEKAQPAALVIPSQEEVEALSQQASDDQTLDEKQRQSLSETLQRVLNRLNQIGESQQTRTQLEQSAAAAADATQAAKTALDQPAETPKITIPDATSLEEVRASKALADTELASAREAKVKLESQIRDRDVRRAELETIILETASELKKLESVRPTKPSDGEDPRLSRAKRWDHAIVIALARERLQTLKQEQQTYAAEAELLPAQLEIAVREVTAKERITGDISENLGKRRDNKVKNALDEYRRKFVQSGAETSAGILALGERWLEIVHKSAELQQKEVEVRSAKDALDNDFEDRKAEVEKDLNKGGELRSSLGLKLQRLRSKLPTLSSIRRDISSVQREIDSVQVLQSEIESRIDELDGGRFLQARVDRSLIPPSVAAEKQLLGQMQIDISAYWSEVIDLKALHEDQFKTVTEYRELIDRNVLWVRSAQPFARTDLPLAWQAFQELVRPSNLQILGVTIWSEWKRRPLIWCLWIASVALLFAFGPRMRRRLVDHGENALHRGQSKMQPTWAALMLTVVLTLPLILLLAVPGWKISSLSDWRISNVPNVIIYVHAIGHALVEAAAFVLPLELLRQICRPGGLASAHFGWTDTTIRSLRTNLRFLLDLGLPLILVGAAAESIGNVRVQSSLGRLMFALLMLVFAGVFWSALNPRKGPLHAWIIRHPDGWIDQLRFLWRPALAALPLFMGVVCLAGYSYATRTLSTEFYATIWLALAMVFARGLLRRWSLINRRQMLRMQAQQRAADRQKLEETPAAFVEETELDVTQINAQTQRLINAALIVVGFVGVAWIWASVLPAVEYLERITLIAGDEGEPPVLTLANLVLALPILVLTFIASKNLPGLLESVVLQRLPLNNAVRYAITSLASYALIVVGIMLGANTLGLRWENIQWLVAALGVGLGFGLQEIFANFISGLILLFEQPIRVGDIVTLGDTTGVVTRIRIRATTVTNWDRQELIIPNKDLITGRLVNWTLTDSTNRIVIKIGVAYGSDTRKACSILEQICNEHPNIVNDPGTVVTFEGFGDSTLDLVVRCYMTTLDGRLGTIHDLHNQINDRFAEADLEIAFPQRDLHLRTLPPDLLNTIEKRAA
jgi:potassium efflux system protein